MLLKNEHFKITYTSHLLCLYESYCFATPCTDGNHTLCSYLPLPMLLSHPGSQHFGSYQHLIRQALSHNSKFLRELNLLSLGLGNSRICSRHRSISVKGNINEYILHEYMVH